MNRKMKENYHTVTSTMKINNFTEKICQAEEAATMEFLFRLQTTLKRLRDSGSTFFLTFQKVSNDRRKVLCSLFVLKSN